MTATDGPTAAVSDRVLVIERVFDARRELVFNAWTKAEHLANWFGPKDFTLPACEIDFRVGGSYRFCMRAPEGEDHWVWGVYREIVRPERLVFTWNRGEDARGRLWSSTVVEVTFEDQSGQTLFRLHQSEFETVPYRDEHAFGWGQSLDRLARFVEQQDENIEK